jgi:hypothetical protein
MGRKGAFIGKSPRFLNPVLRTHDPKSLKMNTRYRAYRNGPAQTGLYSEEAENHCRKSGELSASAELLWEVSAATLEEALSIYHLRMGFEPFVPPGDVQPCPGCASPFYPQGSGQCWRCGKIC